MIQLATSLPEEPRGGSAGAPTAGEDARAVPIEPTGAVQVVVAVGLPYGRASGGGCGGRGARLRLSGMQPARSWHFVFARRVGLEVPLVRRHSLLSLQARQLPLGVRLPFVITSGAPHRRLRNQRDSAIFNLACRETAPGVTADTKSDISRRFPQGSDATARPPASSTHPNTIAALNMHAHACTHTCPQLNRGVYNCQGLAPISLSQEKSSFGALPPSLT